MLKTRWRKIEETVMRKKTFLVQRARARPRAAMPAKALLTPFERAALEGLLMAAEEVELDEEPEVLEEPEVPDEAGAVAVALPEPEEPPVPEELPVPVAAGAEPVRVTPALRQRALAAATAFVRSAPLQVLAIQVETPETKAWFLHRQALSVAEQLPRFALAMQLVAQLGIWRGNKDCAEVDATAAARTMKEKRIMWRLKAGKKEYVGGNSKVEGGNGSKENGFIAIKPCCLIERNAQGTK